jgi:hypothetical protein
MSFERKREMMLENLFGESGEIRGGGGTGGICWRGGLKRGHKT